eukprot:3372230-Prymnesium_polylepis.1
MTSYTSSPCGSTGRAPPLSLARAAGAARWRCSSGGSSLFGTMRSRPSGTASRPQLPGDCPLGRRCACCRAPPRSASKRSAIPRRACSRRSCGAARRPA